MTELRVKLIELKFCNVYTIYKIALFIFSSTIKLNCQFLF